MADDAIEIIRLRNNFYRDNYRRVLLVVLLLILINAFLAGTIFYQIASRPEPQYFATSTDGRITPIYPLNQPMVAPTELLQWASRAAVEANTYNFVNYREAMQEIQNNFTPDGWNYFTQALKNAKTLDMVLAKKLVSSAVLTGAPVILDQGIVNNRYAWKVQMPILVTYQSPSEQTQLPQIITMIITRVPTVNMPRGYAIASFVASATQSSI